MNQGLVGESFNRILDILQQLGLYRKSPKLFIIYAHESEHTKLKAHQGIVRNYIDWFKKILFNVDSDRSPHGYGRLHESVHPGASVDIVSNQMCLLPTSWHRENVDYVLVFYSELLAHYMKDERKFFKGCDDTYSKAIINTCKKYENKPQNPVEKVCEDIRSVQERYSRANKMGHVFHHVLTETALLSFRNQSPGVDYTIPIILSGDDDWETDLKWDPKFVHTTKTQIQITVGSEKEHQQFFKILLMFESLEIHRRPIEVMRKCFDDCVELLKGDVQPEEYHGQVEIHIYEAMRNLNDQWQMIERPITPGHIRDRLNLYSKLDVQSIRRVSGEKLPENLIDIDLAVAERLNSRDELPVDGQQEGMKMPLHGLFNERNVRKRQIVSLHGLFDERKVGKRQIVPLHGLFDERNVGRENIRPQRILIQGRPGIGKTTLCRRLMYEYSWHENLRKKFDLVVRIAVGKLENSADLNNLLFEEYFQAVSEGRDLSNRLGDLILAHESANLEKKNASSVRILIILDGLDEARRWSQERRALLEKLMGRPAVIITSRSHDTDMLHLSVDLHLEALGLNTMSVDAYLDNTRIVLSDTATRIHRFIEAKPFVKDMVRVPIHLDILCYSWDELHRQNAPTESTTDEGEHVSPTMTALYQAVVRSLWRKDIPSLGKLDQGESVNVEIISAVQDSARLERLVHIESNFLEEMANNMMESDRLEFTDDDIAEAIRRVESNGYQLPLSLERNLHKLSLLRSYLSEGHRKYRFVHLTFQEFFAARYLARQVARHRASFETNLRQHKYNRRYEVVWMFFTGLLSKAEELDFFFKLLDDEPRDLVGLQHIHLIMYCLSECQIRTELGHWDEYQVRLKDWLLLEHRIGKYKNGIGSSMAFPDSILRKGLLLGAKSRSSWWRLPFLMQGIRTRISLSENFMQLINQLIADHHDRYLLDHLISIGHKSKSPEFIDTVKRNFTTIWIPEQKAKLPETAISFFMRQIQSERWQGHGAPRILMRQRLLPDVATRILMRQRHLPNVAIRELVEWLKDPCLSQSADKILSTQATLPKETIDSAIEKLFDRRSFSSLRHWCSPYPSSVILRQDLHAEAIAKVWEYLENAALRNVKIPDKILLRVSRTHLLQPDHAERLGNLLLRTERTELVEFAVKALGQQPSLPMNVLEIFVELLRRENSGLFGAAQKILQKQPDLHRDIIDELREFFRNDKHKVVAVLKERLGLPNKASQWLMAQITEGQDAVIRSSQVVDYLLGGSDLPHYLMNSLPELIKKGVSFTLVAESLDQQRKPSNKVVDSLVELIPSDNAFTEMPKVINQAFADPLIKILEHTRSEIKAGNAASMLGHADLDQDSIQRLRSLLNAKPTTELAIYKSRMALSCLLKQINLDREIILDLHNYIRTQNSYEGEMADNVASLWMHRRIEQFWANLALFDASFIHHSLEVFLCRTVEDLAPAYIDGKTLYFYAADGKLTEQRLEDEQAFRENFREAQRMFKIPEWARIKAPDGRREVDLLGAMVRFMGCNRLD